MCQCTNERMNFMGYIGTLFYCHIVFFTTFEQKTNNDYGI